MQEMHGLSHGFVISRITFRACVRVLPRYSRKMSGRSGKRAGIYGTALISAMALHLVAGLASASTCRHSPSGRLKSSRPDIDFCRPIHMNSQKFLLISINSHAIPIPTMSREWGRRTPVLLSRFHTGTPPIRRREIRRASEQTSPQVARAVGHTQ